MHFPAFALLLACSAAPLFAAPLRHAGREVELTVTKLSGCTLGLRLRAVGATDIRLASDATQPDLKREVLWQGAALDQPFAFALGGYRGELTGSPLQLAIRDAEGKPVQTLRWEPEGKTFHFRADAPVFGLGGGGPGVDRRGHLFPMKDGWGGYRRETHGIRVAVPYLISPAGWSLFLNHLPGQQGEIGMRQPDGEYRPEATQEALPFDAYLSLAADPATLVAERALLEGAPPLPPRWALGYMQSHRTLAGPEEILAVAKNFRERRLPCDALIYLGTGYCPAGWNHDHGSLDFNRPVFGPPDETLGALHGMHFKVVLHANNPPETLHGETLAPDGNDTIGSYWESHLPAFSRGVDAWWPDDGDPLSAASRVARHRMYDVGPRRERPDERPWSLHRTGYLGIQKHGGWLWSGDPDSTWETLRAQVGVALNHSLSLTPFWGSDTGGFIPSKELTPELFLRWFQFSCFTPSFRSHGRTWHLRLPWGWDTGQLGPVEMDANFTGLPALEDTRNPAVEPICRKYLDLRYQLLSYNYGLAREASLTGLPMMRPLWFHAPGDAQALACADAYLWGPDLLVAPVLEKGATERRLYLPTGGWFDFWTGKTVDGGREITRSADLSTLPLYVRAGTVLPLDPVRQFTAQSSDAPLTLRIHPGQDGGGLLYQDDGRSTAYRDGKYRVTRLSWGEKERVLRLEPDRSFDPGWPKVLRVEIAGTTTALDVPWDGRALEVKVP